MDKSCFLLNGPHSVLGRPVVLQLEWKVNIDFTRHYFCRFSFGVCQKKKNTFLSFHYFHECWMNKKYASFVDEDDRISNCWDRLGCIFCAAVTLELLRKRGFILEKNSLRGKNFKCTFGECTNTNELFFCKNECAMNARNNGIIESKGYILLYDTSNNEKIDDKVIAGTYHKFSIKQFFMHSMQHKLPRLGLPRINKDLG